MMDIFNKTKDTFNSLITSRHSLDIEELGRRKLFTIFLILLILPLILFGTMQIKAGMYAYGITDYIVALIFITFIAILRYQNYAKNIYRIALILLELLLFYWIQTGAVQGYASLWGLVIPPFAFFLMGKKEGFIWSSVCALFTILLFTNPSSFFTDFSYPPQFISRHLFVFFVIFLFTFNYESIREKYKFAMESEQDKLLLEKDKLAKAIKETDKANSHLKDEMKIRKQVEIELRRHHDHLEDIVAERTLEIKINSEKLQRSEKLYRLMADNVNDLIWTTDLNLNFSFISPSVTRIYGYTVDEAMKLPHDKWNTPDSYNRMTNLYQKEIELIKTGNSTLDKYFVLQLEQIKKNGNIFPVEVKISFIRDENGKEIGIVGITRDISARIAMEQERDKVKEHLAQSQKMEVLGTLVSGLAHDFNNFLVGIIGSFDILSLLLKKEILHNKESIEKYINIGMESSKRSAGLINQLLILSKKHDIKLSPLNIRDSLNHIYDICKNSLPKSIEIHFQKDDSPLIILGDIIQIDQVLLNLCINASHAMTTMRPPGQKHGGTLTVTAEKVKSDHLIKENFPESVNAVDLWIKIKIADTGVGIGHETKQRIFEPFFSTKNTSTGLGLAISYNIVKKHGGIVNVYSEPGEGSCFSLYFPAYNDNDEVIAEETNHEVVPGSGTILVIDDEPSILNIAEGFLEQCGYKVITADGADKGIDLFRNEHQRISAVLVDLSMPEKSGMEVIQELQRISSDVKIILSSGMLDNEFKEIAFKMGVKETVNKPYMAVELSIKINKVLN